MNPALFLPLARALHAQENDFLAMQFYRSYLRSLPDSVDAAVAAQELKVLESELTQLSPDSMVTASFPRTPWWRTSAAGLIGIVLLAGWVLLLRNRFFWQRGVSLAQVALQSPELQPALAYLIGTLRHELLKHRIGAVSQLVRSLASQKHSPSEEQRRFLHQRLFGGTPRAQAWKEHLQGFGRALGAGHQCVRSDADFGGSGGQEEQRSAQQAAAREHLALRSESLMLKEHSHELEYRLRVRKAERELLSSQLGALQDGISKNSQRWRWRLEMSVPARLTFGLLGVIGVATESSHMQQMPSLAQLQVEAQLASKDHVAAARANHAALALMQQQVSTLEQQLAALHRAADESLQALALLSHSGGCSGPHPAWSSRCQVARPQLLVRMIRCAELWSVKAGSEGTLPTFLDGNELAARSDTEQRKAGI